MAGTPADPAAAAPATSLREQGNALFKAGNYLKAAVVYTQALKEDPDNPALYSNRSAAFLELSKVTKALADADMTIKLKPTWEKGYFRRACALEAMKKLEGALAAIRQAAEHNPKSSEIAAKVRHLTRLAREQRRMEGREASKENGVRNGTEYKDAKDSTIWGDDIPHSDARVVTFVKDIIAGATNGYVEFGGKMDSTVYFLPGKLSEEGKEIIMQVVIKEAFESPDTLRKCVAFLREHVEGTKAKAGCAVVPKHAVSFPQRWKERGSKGWKWGDSDGFFVQLESPSQRSIWFVPSGIEKGHHIPGSPELLDVDTYALLPPIFR
eukprot:TRINITY_DN21549_c0_g1_i1.p1 TRINITY_DN21549_c0_g1~~TRINITY_DN21549_c0_g1_i1.p1  ORF type:complete len:324 (+),score=72.67 TRINITY_DN21549_c0_g1_i1:59-1030(+)